MRKNSKYFLHKRSSFLSLLLMLQNIIRLFIHTAKTKTLTTCLHGKKRVLVKTIIFPHQPCTKYPRVFQPVLGEFLSIFLWKQCQKQDRVQLVHQYLLMSTKTPSVIRIPFRQQKLMVLQPQVECYRKLARNSGWSYGPRTLHFNYQWPIGPPKTDFSQIISPGSLTDIFYEGSA